MRGITRVLTLAALVLLCVGGIAHATIFNGIEASTNNGNGKASIGWSSDLGSSYEQNWGFSTYQIINNSTCSAAVAYDFAGRWGMGYHAASNSLLVGHSGTLASAPVATFSSSGYLDHNNSTYGTFVSAPSTPLVFSFTGAPNLLHFAVAYTIDLKSTGYDPNWPVHGEYWAQIRNRDSGAYIAGSSGNLGHDYYETGVVYGTIHSNYAVFDITTQLNGTEPWVRQIADIQTNYQFYFSDTPITLPEPSSIIVLAGGLATILGIRRRRA
ncbi:MAG: PEP-CTERM sorting domain-containing protein [Armatimonadota bacterium]